MWFDRKYRERTTSRCAWFTEVIRDTREAPSEVKFGEDLLLVEVGRRLMVAMKKLEALTAPHPNSVLGKIDELTTPLNASESIRMYLAVAADNLWTLLRYVRKTREVPMVAAYSLIRSAVEATSYGIWVLKGNGNAIKAQRSLRISLGDFEQHGSLQKLFDTEEFDVTEIKNQIFSLNAQLKGVSPEAINKEIQATSIVIAADGQVRDRFYFSGLQVWRSTSGLSHASQPSRDFGPPRTPPRWDENIAVDVRGRIRCRCHRKHGVSTERS